MLPAPALLLLCLRVPQGLQLCSFEDYCPDGPGTQPRGGLKAGNQWAPFLGAPPTAAPESAQPNSWVQVGTGPPAACSEYQPPPPPPPPPCTDTCESTPGWTVDANPVTTCDWVAHICDPMRRGECVEHGGETDCHWQYVQGGFNTPALNCCQCQGFQVRIA